MDGLIAQLETWMKADEDEHLEFKEARNGFHFETLVEYCAALANEGGGRIILGVTDRRPRRIVGSQAFSDLGRTKAGLTDRLHLRIEAWDADHPNGRVVVFDVPSRPIGMPIAYKGAYKMRSGESLVNMTPDMLKRIVDESAPDFSQEICAQATLTDLAPEAIQRLREMWHHRSGNDRLLTLTDEQLLADAELVVGGRVTYAALILLGTHRALGQHLAQAEVVFEYRPNDATGPAADREDLRQGFLTYLDDLWNRINLLNDRQSYQLGFGLTLYGEIQDEGFLRFLERIGSERVAAFSTEDLLLVDLIHREQRIPDELRPRLPLLVSQGVIEASGRGTQYMLSRRFYDFMRQRGVYTRRRGLDRETNKALLLKHIEDNRTEGSPLEELTQVLPSLSRHQVQWLLRTMKAEGRIHNRGQTRTSRWVSSQTGAVGGRS